MRIRWVAVAVVVGVVSATVVAVLAVWQPWRDEQPQWLFAYAADSAVFEDRGSGTYRATFSGGDEHFLAFTDRPDRDVARMDVQAMDELWPSVFADSNPNAVLVEQMPDSERDSVVVEILDVMVDEAELVMDMQVLAQAPGDRGLSIGQRAWDQVPASAGPLHVLIDPGRLPSQPGCQEPFTPYWPPGQGPDPCF